MPQSAATMSEPDLTKPVNGTPVREAADRAESRPNSMYYDDPPEEEINDGHRGDRANSRDSQGQHTKQESKDGRPRTPAYVAPIPRIGKIAPVERPLSISSTGRPSFPRFVTSSLVGKKVDEYGDVVDEDGKVLGRVAGDLPSMVGRSVLNQRGDILGDDGELLGYVAEVESEKEKERARARERDENQSSRQRPDESTSTQSMDEYMAKNKSAFRVDETGTILDEHGNVVGNFHDFNRMGPKPEREEPETAEKEKGPEASSSDKPPQEPRPNAQSYRKEGAGESPSDIFLDVKSTREGIQLTIRIPTVFPDGRTPRINFS